MTRRPAIGASLAALIAVACCAGLPAIVAALGAWLVAPLAGVVVLFVALGSVVVHRRRCRRDLTREAQSR